ncbi:MAG: chloride channel protein [Actinobacteria bacterium]|nr:chloride channel protein [Actinomycetota bacterium]
MLSALLIILAQRLPGHTGESPLTGFHFNDPVRTVPSVLLAATATLIFGASLGPEGPLIVVGFTAAALLMRRAEPNVLSMVMFLGGIAAIGTIFGNPFVTAFMILEFAAMGMAPKVILLPAFVALGAGYLTQIGWGAWSGIGTPGDAPRRCRRCSYRALRHHRCREWLRRERCGRLPKVPAEFDTS